MEEYTRLMLSKGRGAEITQRRSETKWKPPDEGHVKINVDGALSEQQNAFGMGAVARDHSGNVLAAMVCKGIGNTVAEVAEACSLRRALQWANDLALRRIVMETDCASIVTAINSETLTMNSSLGTVLADCRKLMTSFVSCRVQHIRRQGNSVAHELAKRALHAEDDEFWMEEIPEYIAHIVIGDNYNA